MHIFLTGGTGYIGSAVLDGVVRGGHTVDALVRNSEKAAEVRARGARPIVGDLAKPETFTEAASAAEGVILAAFEYSARGQQVDAAAIDAVTGTPGAPGRLLIYTSGVWVLGATAFPADECAPVNPVDHVAWRPAHERKIRDAVAAGFRAVVVRPGIVYGGARGIVGELFKDASNGLIRIVGSGENHWPFVYDRDLGDLFLRLVNHPEASGVYHANDEGDETVNDVVSAIAEQAPIRPSVRRIPMPEARQKFGTYAEALALDQKVRSPRARALGWQPSLHSVAGNVPRLFEEWRRGRAVEASSQ